MSRLHCVVSRGVSVQSDLPSAAVGLHKNRIASNLDDAPAGDDITLRMPRRYWRLRTAYEDTPVLRAEHDADRFKLVGGNAWLGFWFLCVWPRRLHGRQGAPRRVEQGSCECLGIVGDRACQWHFATIALWLKPNAASSTVDRDWGDRDRRRHQIVIEKRQSTSGKQQYGNSERRWGGGRFHHGLTGQVRKRRHRHPIWRRATVFPLPERSPACGWTQSGPPL